MSYEAGVAAINLEMTDKVPRTEYSITGHWEAVSRITGMDVNLNSDDSLKTEAVARFVGPECWDFSFFWSTGVGAGDLGKYRTSMGHAVYAAGGTDWNENIGSYFKSIDEILAFKPSAILPQIPHNELVERFNSQYAQNCARQPGGVNMVGTYVSMVSGMIDLFGWDNFLMAVGMDETKFSALMGDYALWVQRFYEAIAECDAPYVMLHDDIVWTSGPFMHPDWYRKNVFPHYKKYLAPLKEAGKKIFFTSDGDYTMFVDDVAGCGFDCFVMEPMTDMQYIAEKYGKTHSFIGNADTRILLSGTREAIEAEVKRCMDIGKNCPGFFMAVGNHIPSNTPVENVLFYNEMYEKYAWR